MLRPPLIGLIAAALVALLTGAAVGGDDDPASRDRGPAAPTATAVTPAAGPEEGEDDPDLLAARRLSVSQLAGTVNIMRFAGSPLPAYVAAALRNDEAAGVILFRDNLPSPAATKALTAAVQRAARGRALIATDQEGGSIRNLPWLPPDATPPTLTSGPAARAAARATARGLRSAGINVNLAPIADLGGGPIMGGRAFGGGPAAVARLVAETVRAYRGTGVLPTAKHFPGLGAATANTDDAPATIGKPAREIGADDLPPFRAAIAAGVPLIMLSHARYPALDRRAVASQSRAIVTDLLKRRLGFGGVAITDSIEARAVSGTMGPGEAAVRSVRAGIDLVLTTGPGSHLRVHRALQRAARRDPAFRARMTDAAARVLRLRRALRG